MFFVRVFESSYKRTSRQTLLECNIVVKIVLSNLFQDEESISSARLSMSHVLRIDGGHGVWQLTLRGRLFLKDLPYVVGLCPEYIGDPIGLEFWYQAEGSQNNAEHHSRG